MLLATFQGTHWQLDWNTIITQWGKEEKNPSTPNPKEKKKLFLEMHVKPFRWPHEFYDLKLFVIIFGLG